MRTGADVIVVGAGVIGLSIAWRLSQAGAKVVVVDRGEPGGEASWAAAGILSAQAEAAGEGPLFELLWRSQGLFSRFVAELEDRSGHSCGYRQSGALHLGASEPEMAEVADQRRWQLARGLLVEAWDRQALRAAEPALAHAFLGANHFPQSGRIEPRRLSAALLAVHEAGGARLQRDEVQALECEGDRVTGVRVSGEVWPTGQVVVAAGAWSSLIAGTGLAADAVRPVRGQLVGFTTASPLLERVVFADGGYLLPGGENALVAGSTMEEVGFARGVTPDAQQTIVGRARRICPALADIAPSRAWSGLRPATRDGLPALGPTPISGLHLAVGHYRNGILLAPITAELVAAAVLSELGPATTPASPAIPGPVAAARLYA